MQSWVSKCLPEIGENKKHSSRQKDKMGSTLPPVPLTTSVFVRVCSRPPSHALWLPARDQLFNFHSPFSRQSSKCGN